MRKGDVYVGRKSWGLAIFVVESFDVFKVNGYSNICLNNHKRISFIKRYKEGWFKNALYIDDLLKWYKLEGYTYTWILDT